MNPNRSMLKLAVVALVLVIGSVMAPVVMAAPPVPSLGVATVDGNYSEWDLSKDFFADMVEAGKDGKDLLSKLYLRYDCATSTLYALVLAEPGYTIDVDNGNDNYIKLGQNTKIVDASFAPADGTTPDWSWIGLNGGTATGWEASAPLAPGSYTDLYPHTQITPGRTSRPVGWFIPVTVSSCQLAALGDFVWLDTNNNGIQDSGETGIPGVTVNLFTPGADDTCNTADDGAADTATTDADGLYHFTDLTPGAYCVQFVAPAGYAFSPQNRGGDGTKDSDADPATGWTTKIDLAAGQTDNTWDAGLYGTLSLGDYVWNDKNQDGIQGPSVQEPAFDNVPVWLFGGQCNTANDYNDAGLFTPLQTTTTAGGGLYLFEHLTPGAYCVVIPNSAFLFGAPLAGLDPTTPISGTNTAVDSNGILQQNIASGTQYVHANVPSLTATDLTFDFGFFSGVPTAVTLSSLAASGGVAQPLTGLAVIACGLVLTGGAVTFRRRRSR